MRPQGFLAFPSWLLSLVLSHQIYPLTGDNPSRAQLTTNFYIDCGLSLWGKVCQDLPRIEVLKEFHYQQKCPLPANVAICRELVGEETSAAMSSNVWICILLMLRFVHFWCWDLCTFDVEICALYVLLFLQKMWGSQEQSAGGFWGGNHHRVQITSAIIILMNHHHCDHDHHQTWCRSPSCTSTPCLTPWWRRCSWRWWTSCWSSLQAWWKFDYNNDCCSGRR